MSALKRKLSSRVAAFQLSQCQCSPNSSNDVQRSRDQGPGSLTLTMSPAAAGQPGHRSAIGVWSPSTRPQVLNHSNSFSHFTESLQNPLRPLTFIFITYKSHHLRLSIYLLGLSLVQICLSIQPDPELKVAAL